MGRQTKASEAEDTIGTKENSPGERLSDAIGLAVVAGPVDEARVLESPGGAPGINLKQHVGVGVVAGGGHDIVRRAVGVGEVDPLVHMAGDDELNGLLMLAQGVSRP